ncbi:hypothetical protein CNMCM5793_005238 [Aspergillus hiratsukae]|uniref:SMP-30/Gluconolactonase/LRE-like region domain-containing protein n=1 Tax=Aspergillus hiratsukae TaxID=1194566 RepID=A0A8H6QC90_9EURO|nr:hypothetical protein CNMCM5793_005238 [Aspergillus hiratsukae]KAF7171045.1 hypothetical protein CNMCM6106_005542 [Aspergillus hiratsukae]
MYSRQTILWLHVLITTLISPTLAFPAVPITTNASSISTVFQFTRNETWLENLAVRPNGKLLATRLDAPELWLIDPANTNTTEAGSLFHTFPNATSLLGITEINTDVYAVVAGNFSIPTVTSTHGSYVIWRLDASSTPPSASILARIPDAEFLNGIARFGENMLLITDSAKGVIWLLDMSTGVYSQALSHPSMLPAAGQPYAVGVNGIDVRGKYVYYTSTTQMLFCRVPVDSTASATGPVEVIASGITPDDFIVSGDGTAFITTNPDNGLVRVDPKGRVRLVAGNQFTIAVGGSTAVAGSEDGSVLYVTTSGGQFSPILGKLIEPAKVVAIHL